MTEGAQPKYVTLVSSDGFEFVVLRDATVRSTVIKSMLDPGSGFQEAQTGICRFQDIRYGISRVDARRVCF